MRTVTYISKDEKQLAIIEAESQGETQLHDNHFFTDGIFDHGELIFYTIIDPPPTAEEIADEQKQVELQGLQGKVRGGAATLDDLRRYLVLRDRLQRILR